MDILLAADIYGVTPALMALSRELPEPVRILSPWDGGACPFASESEAHATFVAGDRMPAYARSIERAADGVPVFLVGFSVGATAAWLYASGEAVHPKSRAWLFYGSRIRNHLDSIPGISLKAIFAEEEAAFSPASIASRLVAPTVDVQIVPRSRHGFMNRQSPGFSAALYECYVAAIAAEVAHWRSRL